MHREDLPRFRTVVRTALPNLVEATLVPMALFYATMALVGTWEALIVALVWDGAALARRMATHQRVTGMLLLGTLAMLVRTAIAFASGSLWVYFLQPTLGTVATAGVFALSVPAGRPLAGKLAKDFWPIPADVGARPCVRRLFRQLSYLWALVYVANAAITLWILLTQPLGAYLVAKHFVSLGLTVPALAFSVMQFRRTVLGYKPAVEPVGPAIVSEPVPALALA